MTQDELKRVLGCYGLGELRRARRVERGFVNENWVIETTRGRYFLKRRHREQRDSALIRAQHSLIKHLRRSEFPAPTILLTTDGETLLILDGEFYEIQEYIDGVPYEHTNEGHFRAAAAMLGRYHACAQDFVPRTLRRSGDLYGPEILATNLTHLTEAWSLRRDETLREILGQLESHAADLKVRFGLHGDLPRFVVHGDYYGGNLLIRNDRIVGVVDYDKASWQPRIAELAEALIYFASPWHGHLKHLVYHGFLQWDNFASFLRYYAEAVGSDRESRVLLRETEVRSLPDYIRCIWLAMSLQRLREKGLRPADPVGILREVLALGDWATANTQGMVEAGHTAVATQYPRLIRRQKGDNDD